MPDENPGRSGRVQDRGSATAGLLVFPLGQRRKIGLDGRYNPDRSGVVLDIAQGAQQTGDRTIGSWHRAVAGLALGRQAEPARRLSATLTV